MRDQLHVTEQTLLVQYIINADFQHEYPKSINQGPVAPPYARRPVTCYIGSIPQG